MTTASNRAARFGSMVLQISAVLLSSVTWASAQPTVKFTEYPVPARVRTGITVGPDGALWVSETDKDWAHGHVGGLHGIRASRPGPSS